MNDVEVLDAPAPRHGGARPNSGPKKGYKKTEESVNYDKAKARHEMAKAEMAELDLLIKTRRYVDRLVMRQALSTAYASLAQTLRSIPDLLERNIGLSPEVAEEVGRQIDESLSDIATEFEMMGGAENPELDPLAGDIQNA